MDPVTHVLTGAVLSRAGLNRRAAYATAVMAISAELPDMDTVWGLRGPVESFVHHRGITHTFIAVPAEAAVVVGSFYAWHRFRARGRVARLKAEAPLSWGWLYLGSVLALLSHLLLDYTNNYGLRPFLPFDSHWYAGSFVFIFDPLLFFLLLLPFILPPVFALIAAEVGTRRQAFPGRGFALTSLLLIGFYWTLRLYEHGRAERLAMEQSLLPPKAVDTEQAPTATAPQQPFRVLASPDPFNPFRWYLVSDYGDFYQLATANLRDNTVKPAQATFAKPLVSPALVAAEGSPLGRAYMDWSSMPLLTVSAPGDPGRVPDAADSAQTAGNTVVTFRDPRFLIDLPLLPSNHAPLSAVVELDAHLRVVRQTMGGRSEH